MDSFCKERLSEVKEVAATVIIGSNSNSMVWKGVNVAFRVVLGGISALSESEWLINFLSTHGPNLIQIRKERDRTCRHKGKS